MRGSGLEYALLSVAALELEEFGEFKLELVEATRKEKECAVESTEE